MIDSKAGLTFFVLIGLFGLPVAACIEHVTTPVEEADTRDEQREVMNALLGEVDRENLLRAVETIESHGNPNAVSSKGAKGRYQLMDRTAHKPGFGVRPLRNRSQKEQKRFAKDYLSAMMSHYQRVLSEAAYNAGPTAVDKAFKEALAKLPVETEKYVGKVEKEFAENGE